MQWTKSHQPWMSRFMPQHAPEVWSWDSIWTWGGTNGVIMKPCKESIPSSWNWLHSFEICYSLHVIDYIILESVTFFSRNQLRHGINYVSLVTVKCPEMGYHLTGNDSCCIIFNHLQGGINSSFIFNLLFMMPWKLH